MGIFGNKKIKTNDKDNAKIKMVEVGMLHFDRDFKRRVPPMIFVNAMTP